MYLNVRLDAFWRESQGNHIALITFLPLLLSIKGRLGLQFYMNCFYNSTVVDQLNQVPHHNIMVTA